MSHETAKCKSKEMRITEDDIDALDDGVRLCKELFDKLYDYITEHTVFQEDDELDTLLHTLNKSIKSTSALSSALVDREILLRALNEVKGK